MSKIMKTLIAIISGLTLSAAAWADDLAGQVFNITMDGMEYTTSFHEGGTYTNSLGGSGSWSMEDGTLCLTPMQAAESICNSWESLEVGESCTTNVWNPQGGDMVITRIE